MSNPSLTEWWPEQPLAVLIGAGGMGMAVARRLGQQHRLLVTDIDSDKLNAQVSRLMEEGIRAEALVCDITNPAAVAKLASRVSELGGFTVLAHVTGLSPSMGGWRQIMAVNLIGPTLVTDALLPLAGKGSVAILIASLSAYLGQPDDGVTALLREPLAPDFLDRLDAAIDAGMTPQLSYSYSKYALIRLTRRLAVTWGEKGARALSISPGLIATPQGTNEFKQANSKLELLRRCPLQRQGGMQEIADAVEFLVSARASYINGIDLVVDGGILAGISPE
jgi:NAD(P)-dependent dehydrogenase (short-subunit alcohol dehydrogenase family)